MSLISDFTFDVQEKSKLNSKIRHLQNSKYKKIACPFHSRDFQRNDLNSRKVFNVFSMSSQWEPRSLYTHKTNCKLYIYIRFLQKFANIKVVFVFLYCSCEKRMKEKNTLATYMYLIKTKLIHVLISCYTNISFTLFNALLFITFLSLSANLFTT